MLDEQSGVSSDGTAYKEKGVVKWYSKDGKKAPPAPNVSYGGKGGASRFFYCAKASKKERNAGCEGLPEKQRVFNGQSAVSSKELSDVEERFTTQPSSNHHPTVKPLALMRYLVKLTKTPTGGVVLDPFMGSGTTGVACKLEGRDFIGIEREEEYIEIAKARINNI